MAAATLREESPRWLAIMGYLEANGALEPAGHRVRIPDFSAAVSIPERGLKDYLARMEALGVLEVVRTSIDGQFGTPRGPNIYRLRCTVEAWKTDLGPQVAEAKRTRSRTRTAAKRRVSEAEKARKFAQADAKAAKAALTAQAVPRPVPVDDGTIEALTERFLANGESLAGW